MVFELLRYMHVLTATKIGAMRKTIPDNAILTPASTGPVRMLNELYRRGPILTVTGWIHLALLVLGFILFWFDSREILGINPWIKPIKFSLSIWIYLWTMAFLFGFLSVPRLSLRGLGGVISLAMFTEIVCIYMQSFRGTISHFNGETDFGGFIYALMGVMIAINTVMVVIVLIMFFTNARGLSPLVTWGVRLGIIGFLLGSAVGGNMTMEVAHTIGAPDGGPGLPFLNWSTIAGDLRIAHFLGLHTVQLFPLAAYGLSMHNTLSAGQKWFAFILFVVLYSALFVGIYIQALQGLPLIAL